MSGSELPEAGCSCGWHGRAIDADGHVCGLPDLPDDRAEPDSAIVSSVELIAGWPITAASIGVWTGAEDGVPRLFPQAADWPFTPDMARLLGDQLHEVADLVPRPATFALKAALESLAAVKESNGHRDGSEDKDNEEGRQEGRPGRHLPLRRSQRPDS